MNVKTRWKLLLPLTVFFTSLLVCDAQDTNKPAGEARSVQVEITVLRFKPLKAERLLRGFKDLKGDLSAVVENLKADGEISILYTANRDLRLEDKAKAKFDALETRPIVIIGKPGAPIPPATAYGVKLEVTPRPGSGDKFGLNWEGEVSWSPEIVDRWQGEKFLSFAGGAVSALGKSGLLGKDVSQNVDVGLNLAQLFNPKGKPTENEIYELPVNKTVSFSGSRNCTSGQLIINATTAEMGNKEAQTILLLLNPTVLQ